jgi:diaminohydroxyphosphoribosylaminopyrimidine deaminase / 5-amino-6-(5-phosphoribosylamino)uracil reductase
VISPGPFPPKLLNGIESPVAADWDHFLKAFFGADPLPASPLQAVFEPLRKKGDNQMMVVAQIGQTLDGRIATITGQSKYINGQDGLAHLHRLRALVDAVVIGVDTAITDDPLLTVRLVKGQNPARIVIDPRGRLATSAKVWQQDGVRKIWVTSEDQMVSAPPEVENLALPLAGGQIDPHNLLQSLLKLGISRVLIEGGAKTVSRFLEAKCLDHLHLIVAPIVMGSGRPSFELPPILHMDQATRMSTSTHVLGMDILFDCNLHKN